MPAKMWSSKQKKHRPRYLWYLGLKTNWNVLQNHQHLFSAFFYSIIEKKGTNLPKTLQADIKQDLLISEMSKISDISCLDEGNGVDSVCLIFDKKCKMPEKDAHANWDRAIRDKRYGRKFGSKAKDKCHSVQIQIRTREASTMTFNKVQWISIFTAVESKRDQHTQFSF